MVTPSFKEPVGMRCGFVSIYTKAYNFIQILLGAISNTWEGTRTPTDFHLLIFIWSDTPPPSHHHHHQDHHHPPPTTT